MEANRTVVIYADDDDLVRDVVTQVLIHEGLDVHACDNGREAVSLCRQLAPDAVLLDLNMPQFDGFDTARALRVDSVCENVRLVALTGRGTSELRRHAIEAGFDQFLVKPVTGPTLVHALRPPPG